MIHIPWNRPLPQSLALSGRKRFDHPLADFILNQVITTGTASFPALEVNRITENRGQALTLQAVYDEKPPDLPSSKEFPQPPILDHMDWDWIAFHYQPLPDLAAAVTHWVPDPRVICGSHVLENKSSQPREISLKLFCQGELKGKKVPFTQENFQGRTILTSRTIPSNQLLFLTGEKFLTSPSTNQLQAAAVLGPAEKGEIRWVLVSCNSAANAREFLEETIKLDWKGEISRRKIDLSNQLQIKTGNDDWDFSLAFSQRQARLTLNQLLLQRESSNISDPGLTPLGAWQLLLALIPFDPSCLEGLINAAEGEKNANSTPLPLLAELLWRALGAGLNPTLLGQYIPWVSRNLTTWFSTENDRDGDSIPEEPGRDFYPLAPPQQNGTRRDEIEPGDHALETPGLAALLDNEISQLGKLQQMYSSTPPDTQWNERQKTLRNFILDSWQDEQSRFQSRDHLSHHSQEGCSLSNPLLDGWHLLQSTLPDPARLEVLVRGPATQRFPDRLSVTLHGRDWLGRHRIEELTAQQFLWQQDYGLGVTQSIFSRLDHCVVDGLGNNQELHLNAARTDRWDLSLTLALWSSSLPAEISQKSISAALAESAPFWSPFGYQSLPRPEKSLVSLPMNLLVVQGLIRNGYSQLAGEILGGWLDAAAINLRQRGCLYNSWDPDTGLGMGKPNQLESSLPMGLMLALSGVEFQGNRELLLKENLPQIHPIQIFYRGIEITIQEKETMICQPGGEITIYPRGEEAIIPL